MSNTETEKENFTTDVIEIIGENATLFHDQDGEGYALVKTGDLNRVYRIRSNEFANYVAHAVWQQLERPMGANVRETVTATIEAMARMDGKKYDLSIRVARRGDELWYDLGGKAVRITSAGWEVVNDPPIMFKRFPHQREQVEPMQGGNLEDVLRYINVPATGQERDYMATLILTYLPSVLIPDIPRPVLAIHGLPGAAKSTFFKIIKDLVDPSSLDTMTYPRDTHELVQMLSHHFMVCFDNLSELSDWKSDEICKAVTGQAFSKRRLFTDDDDVIYSYKRAIGLNGINLVATKSDLLDRSLIFELQPIPKDKRLNEEMFWPEFQKEKPKILGAMFTALSRAMDLKQRGLVVLEKKPRLADYAVWASAVSMALGHNANDFIAAYERNVEKQNDEAIDSSAIAQTIIYYLEKKPVGIYRKTSKDLFEELKKYAKEMGLDKDKEFPKTQVWLWRRIKPVKGNLQNIGIEAEYWDNIRPREISLRKVTNKSGGNDDTAGKKLTPEQLQKIRKDMEGLGTATMTGVTASSKESPTTSEENTDDENSEDSDEGAVEEF